MPKVIDSVLELVRHIPSFSLLLFENDILCIPKERRNGLIPDDVSDAKHREQDLWLLRQNTSTKFLSFSTSVQSISSTFYIEQISVENIIYNLVCCCTMFHFYLFPILLACSTRHHLPKPSLCGAGAAGYSGDNIENEQIYADTRCRISHAEIPIPNPSLRTGEHPR